MIFKDNNCVRSFLKVVRCRATLSHGHEAKQKGDVMSEQREVKWSRKVLAEFLDINPVDIKDTSKLGEDLGIGEAAGPFEITDLWSRIEEAAGIKIPKQIRMPAKDLLAKTAAQFDAIATVLTGKMSPYNLAATSQETASMEN